MLVFWWHVCTVFSDRCCCVLEMLPIELWQRLGFNHGGPKGWEKGERASVLEILLNFFNWRGSFELNFLQVEITGSLETTRKCRVALSENLRSTGCVYKHPSNHIFKATVSTLAARKTWPFSLWGMLIADLFHSLDILFPLTKFKRHFFSPPGWK